MIAAVTTGWIVAGVVVLVVSVFISILAGKAIDTGTVDHTVDELEAARRRHAEQERRDESGGGAA